MVRSALSILLVLAACLALVTAASVDAQLQRRKGGKAKHRPKAKFGTVAGKSRIATSPASASDVFCTQFTAACYDVALNGRAPGQVQVEHSCKRLGKKYAVRYQFSCVVDGQERTQAVLDKTGGGYTVTTTVAGSTTVVTGTATVASTTATTTTAATTLPTTVTSSTSTTTYALGPTGVAVTNVIISVNPLRKRFTDDDDSTFCQEFVDACTRQCASRAKTAVRGSVCRAEDAMHYSLACYCKGGKIETQHALADAAQQQHVSVVSTVATSSTTVTMTSMATFVATASTTVYTPTTVSIATTTQTMLSPTGYLGVYDIGTDVQNDVLAVPNSRNYLYSRATYAGTTPITFIAVKDANGPLYKLIHADGTQAFTAGTDPSNDPADFEPGGNSYLVCEPRSLTSCDAASTTAAPPAGSNLAGQGCEQYVFDMHQDALTPQLASLNATLRWTNPLGSASATTADIPTYWETAGGQGWLNVQQIGSTSNNAPLYDLRFPVLTRV